MVQEVCHLSHQLDVAEKASSAVYEERDALQHALVDFKAQHQMKTSKVKSKIQDLDKKNKALRERNAEAKKRVDELQQQLDAIVSDSWKEHIYAQQNSIWFKDFERKMMN